METIFTYFIQSALGTALFYLLYLLLLKNETFYQTNRYYLLSGLLLAVVLPLFPITYTSTVEVVNNSEFFSLSESAADGAVVSAIPPEAVRNPFLGFSQILTIIYVVGVLFFSIRLIWQTLSISTKIKNSPSQVINGVKVIHQLETVPYSYFNVVFIDIQNYSERELSNIIAHEKVHISERHWIDLLITELLTVLFWVNPVVWLYERAIKQNHEYLADRGVLLAGYNLGQYRALLINQLTGVKVAGFAHNLNFSLNKKRMEMMKKEKSPRMSKIKLLSALPLIALLVFAFAKKEYVAVPATPEHEPTQETILNSGWIETVDLPTSNSVSDEQVKVSGIIQNNKSEPFPGANIIIKGTTTGTVSNCNGIFIIETPSDGELVFVSAGYEKQTHKVSELTGESAVITLANAVIDPNKKLIKLDGTVKGEDGKLLTGASVVVQNTSTGTVVDENGKFKLEVPDKSRIVISYVGYQTVSRGITSDFSSDSEFKVTYTLAKGVYDIKLPKITDEEIVDVPPPALTGTKGEVYTVVEEMPSYKNGGMHGLASDLKVMTTAAIKQTPDRGEAVVGFTVTEEGKVSNPHIVKSSGSAVLDDVAKKFVQKLDNWNPGSQRGKSVKVDLTVPVNFN